MTVLLRDLALGWRLASSASGRSWLRIGLSAVAGVVATLLLTAALATQHAIATQDATVDARAAWGPPNPDATAPLLITQRRESYAGEQLTVRPMVVTNAATAPVPPGLQRLPEPGEMIGSPAFAAAWHSDAGLRARFPQELIGTIGQVGVVAPGELLVYVGARAYPGATKQMQPVAGFGDRRFASSVPVVHGAPQTGWGNLLTPAGAVTLAVSLYVLLPLAIFIAVATRLSAATRDRKLANLRVIGFSARRCQLINMVETVLATGVGGVVGLGLFYAIRAMSDEWWIGPSSLYSSDLVISPSQMVVVLLIVPPFAAAVSALSIGRSLRDPFRTVRREATQPSRWRIAPAIVGLVLLAISVVIGKIDPRGGPSAAFGLVPVALGAVLLLTGMLLWLPNLYRQTGAILARGDRLPRRLGGASLAYDAPAGSRVLAGVLISLCVGGIGTVAGASVNASAEPPETFDGQLVNSTIYGPIDPDTARRLRAVAGVEAYVEYRRATASTPAGQPVGGVLIASCSEIRALYTGARDCADGAVYRTQYSAQRHDPGQRLVVKPGPDAGISVRVPASAEQLTLTSRTRSGLTDPVAVVTTAALPPDWPSTERFGPTSTILISGGVAAANEVRTILSAQSPAAKLQGPLIVREAFDPATIVPILTALAVITWSLGGLALVVAGTDDAVRRRREATALRAVGLGQAALRKAQLVRLLLPMLLGATCATIATTLTCIGLLRALGKPPALAFVAPPVMAAATLILCLLLIVPAIAGTGGRINAEALHRE